MVCTELGQANKDFHWPAQNWVKKRKLLIGLHRIGLTNGSFHISLFRDGSTKGCFSMACTELGQEKKAFHWPARIESLRLQEADHWPALTLLNFRKLFISLHRINGILATFSLAAPLHLISKSTPKSRFPPPNTKGKGWVGEGLFYWLGTFVSICYNFHKLFISIGKGRLR